VKLARVNTILLIAIVLINGYIIVLPLLPGLFFSAAGRNSVTHSALEAKVQAGVALQNNTQENRLVIPSMLLDEPINDGHTIATLRKGLWRRPQTSTPGDGGNTVIVGHRFTYTQPQGTLYHLDKVQVGDPIGITWNGKSYVYTVRETKVVSPNDTSVEAPTTAPTLTIYTCTPLWLPKDRLVVIATPETPEDNS